MGWEYMKKAKKQEFGEKEHGAGALAPDDA